MTWKREGQTRYFVAQTGMDNFCTSLLITSGLPDDPLRNTYKHSTVYRESFCKLIVTILSLCLFNFRSKGIYTIIWWRLQCIPAAPLRTSLFQHLERQISTLFNLLLYFDTKKTLKKQNGRTCKNHRGYVYRLPIFRGTELIGTINSKGLWRTCGEKCLWTSQMNLFSMSNDFLVGISLPNCGWKAGHHGFWVSCLIKIQLTLRKMKGIDLVLFLLVN